MDFTKTDNGPEQKKGINIAEYINKGADAVYSTFCRFPLTILFFAAIAVLTIYRIDVQPERAISEILDRVTGVLVLGVLLSLSVNVLFERLRLNINAGIKVLAYAAECGLLALYFMFLILDTGMVSMSRLALVAVSLGLCFLFIPYFLKKENYEIYITKIITRAVTTVFYTVVLALGICAILFAIQSLLYTEMSYKAFAYTWIIAWNIYAPLHFLFGFPKMEDTFSMDNYNKILKVLMLYIVLPVIAVYTLVLYIYFGKIVITWVWPSGIVSYLVLSYTAAGIASIFLISPFREENRWVKVFVSFFTKLVFPLLAMMFISISIRINEFGFTENRYFILAIGIWATLAMIYINFNKGRRNIILPVSLAVVAILVAFGPWSAFNVSKISQSNRFYGILSKYNMIQDGKVVNNNGNVEEKDKIEVSEILRYFERFHKFSDLKYLPEGFEFSKMKETFGFAEIYSYATAKAAHFGYRMDEEKPMDISEYDVFFRFRNHKSKVDASVYEEEIQLGEDKIMMRVTDKNSISLLLDGEEIYNYDVRTYVRKMYEKYGESYKEYDELAQEDFRLNDENNKIKVLIMFTQVYGNINRETKEIVTDVVEADILVKIKD